jgi:FMN phosphatase YigB (HAD superfamily)
MSRLGADPATTIHVGDVPAVDVEGARAAGVTPLLLDRHDLYPQADSRRIRSLRELPGLLAQNEWA